MIKVLFVCTGNICRSPTAAGLMRAHVAKAGLETLIEVDSAGTHAYHAGEPPDRRSVAAARRHQLDIAHLRARQVESRDFDEADLILVMERKQAAQLQALCPPGRQDRIHLLMSFAPHSGQPEVPDPYYDDNGFDIVFDLIEQGVLGVIDHLRGTVKNPGSA